MRVSNYGFTRSNIPFSQVEESQKTQWRLRRGDPHTLQSIKTTIYKNIFCRNWAKPQATIIKWSWGTWRAYSTENSYEIFRQARERNRRWIWQWSWWWLLSLSSTTFLVCTTWSGKKFLRWGRECFYKRLLIRPQTFKTWPSLEQRRIDLEMLKEKNRNLELWHAIKRAHTLSDPERLSLPMWSQLIKRPKKEKSYHNWDYANFVSFCPQIGSGSES